MIEVVPNKFVFQFMDKLFETVDHLEGREILQLDLDRGIKIVIVDIVMKIGFSLDDIKLPSTVEIMNILKEEGNRYTVIIRARAPGKMMGKIMKLFDLDLIYDLPYYADKDHFIFSCVGESDPIRKLVKLTKVLGEVKNVSLTKATFSEHNILNVLTNKQKDIMIEAKRHGYYNYPRDINTQDLSEKLGISKATTVEHLRKAEMRLINDLLEGY